MQHMISYDGRATHLDWALDGVTARMIDWFWSNMEKAFVLWHPEQHEPLQWAIAPRDGAPLGAVHNAPQTWDDGRRQDLYIRFERLEEVGEDIREVIAMEHVMIVAGLGFDAASIAQSDPLGYRVHQWSKSDAGVVGRSSAYGRRKPESEADGRLWAAHAAGEIGNWERFLPELYRLYKAVTDARRNPYTDLSVDGAGRAARHRFAKPLNPR